MKTAPLDPARLGCVTDLPAGVSVIEARAVASKLAVLRRPRAAP